MSRVMGPWVRPRVSCVMPRVRDRRALTEETADCDMLSSRIYLVIKTLDVKSIARVASWLRNSFGRDAQLLQEGDQRLALGLRQSARCSFERRRVLREDPA